MTKVTISLIKADVGGFPGHATVHPQLCEKAEEFLLEATQTGLIADFRVMACGDDLELLMGHARCEKDPEVHGLAWKIFTTCTDVAKVLKLYLSLIHISEPTRLLSISYAVFCLKKK